MGVQSETRNDRREGSQFTISRRYIFGFLIIVLFAGLAIWYLFFRASPFLPVAGTYCGVQSGTSYCYELKDDGTYALHVKREGSDAETTFESKYSIDGSELSIDTPNEQIGQRTIFTIQGDKLCAGDNCLFVKQG